MITVTLNVYLNQTGIVFIDPVNPGTTAVVGGGPTDPKNSAIEQGYKVKKTA